MSLVRCHHSNIYPCFVHDRLVYRLATPTSFLKTDKPVIKSITISDEMIIANNRLSISETFWFRLIKSIFQNRLLFNSPPPLQMNALHIFHPGYHVKELICVWPSLFGLTITLCREYFITPGNQLLLSSLQILRSALLHCRWRDFTCRWFHIWKRLYQGVLSYQSDRIRLNVYMFMMLWRVH